MELLNITTGVYLNAIAKKNPAVNAIVESGTGRSITWQALETQVEQVARGMLKAGLVKGDRLIIWSVNTIEWVVIYLGAAQVGIIPVSASIHLKKPEFLKLVKQVDANAICYSHGFRDINFPQIVNDVCIEYQANKGNTPFELKLLIHLEEQNVSGSLSVKELQTLGEPLDWAVYQAAVDAVMPKDTANIQLTSGSTATPKAVMLSHHSLINNAHFSAQRLGVKQQDKICLCVPFFHCFGLSNGIYFLLSSGCELVLMETYRLEELMINIEKYRCTVLSGVPTMFSRLIENENFERYDMSSLIKGVVAGAYCSPALIKDISIRLGMTQIAISYGQTETSPCCTQTLLTDSIAIKCSTVGKPLSFVEMKVINLITGEDCPTAVEGELCTRGYHVMQGYYKNSEQTSKVFDTDGWLHTGDMGFVDEQGYYHYLYRRKEIIIRGGENISPQEVEMAILEHPAVELVKVCGVEVGDLGEEVAASVGLKKNKLLCEDELREFLKSRIAHYKIPVFINILEIFPYYTPSGKIDALALKKVLEMKVQKSLITKKVPKILTLFQHET